MFQGGRRLGAGKRLFPRPPLQPSLGASVAQSTWSWGLEMNTQDDPETHLQRPRHGTAASANLFRLQLPDALSLRQTRLLQRAASRMQSCTLPGPAFFRSARHLTCSVLSGVVLRRLLSSGNIVNWNKNYGSTEKMMVQEQHPRDLARAREKVRVRDHNPRQPIRLGGCDAAAQAREHVCP